MGLMRGMMGSLAGAAAKNTKTKRGLGRRKRKPASKVGGMAQAMTQKKAPTGKAGGGLIARSMASMQKQRTQRQAQNLKRRGLGRRGK